MPNVRAFRAGNWSDTNPATSPWGTGGVLYAPASNDDVWLNNFNVTLDVSATVISITNGSASSRLWKDGATTTATAGGTLTLSNGVTLTGNCVQGISTTLISVTGSASGSIVGNLSTSGVGNQGVGCLLMNTTGVVNVTGSVTGNNFTQTTGWGNHGIVATAGTLNVVGEVIGPAGGNGSAAPSYGIFSTTAPIINITGNVTSNASGANGSGLGIVLTGAATLSIVGNATAGSTVGANAINSSNASAVVSITGNITATDTAAGVVAIGNANLVFSGSLNSSANGTQPVYATRYRVNPAPLNARTRYASNGTGSYVDMFTADNNLGQANPTDVRSGVSYASGNLTGRLTIPARGTVANGVTVGPNMPFTATRSGTTATATLAYSYPYSVGDVITVTGASNSEWNMNYTIASVISGTSVTFTVPDTHSATAGTGANMQTTGTAVLDPTAVASAVWGAASRTITGGLVDTATTLTNAPTVPTPAQIATQVRTELGTELGRIDATVSSRLASSAYTAPTTPPTAAQNATAVRTELGTELARIDAIKAKTDALNTDRLAQVSTVSTTGAQLAAALS